MYKCGTWSNRARRSHLSSPLKIFSASDFVQFVGRTAAHPPAARFCTAPSRTRSQKIFVGVGASAPTKADPNSGVLTHEESLLSRGLGLVPVVLHVRFRCFRGVVRCVVQVTLR